MPKPKKRYYGYDVRLPFPGEDKYFIKNPHVAGMAAEDGAITLNPYSKGVNLDAVAKNEAARLWLRENSVKFPFDISDSQREYFSGTAYEDDEESMKHTIVGRIISGDPSAGEVSEEQRRWAEWLRKRLEARD